MSIFLIIPMVIFVLAILIVISYKFRDAFFLFEGICFVLDALGEVVSDIDFDFDGD